MNSPVSEPSDVGPIADGHLRVSDSDRDQVSTVLGTAYAEGRITADEHAERLDQVLQARTFDDLIPVTRDLIPDPRATALPASTGATSTGATTTGADSLIDTSHESEPERLIAIFGHAGRNGPYRVRRATTALATFGGIDLDLTEAVFEAPVVELTVFTCFGGVNVLVPDGVVVRDETAGIFGGTNVESNTGASGGPVLVVKGVNFFGGTSVEGVTKKRRKKH